MTVETSTTSSSPGSGSQTLGEFLRHERERRGMTIEQVASATKINVRMLHALEADHFAELPAKPFVRGFVTSYCRFIGLAPKEILTRFGDFIDDKAHDRPNRDAGHSGYAFEKREGEQSRTVLWFAMGGFIAVGGVVFAFLKPSLHHHHSTHVDKLRSAHPEAVVLAPGATPDGAPPATADGAPNGAPAGASNPGAPAANAPVAANGAAPTTANAGAPNTAAANANSAAGASASSGMPTPPLENSAPPQAAAPAAPAAPEKPPLVGPVRPPSVADASANAGAGPANAAATNANAPAAAAADAVAPQSPAADAGTAGGSGLQALDLQAEPAAKDDPLASGVTLKHTEIHHKVIFKAGDDVWVRYRVDGKPVMRFILRKNRVLVLRARKVIRFQTSDPDSITFNYNSQGSRTMTSRAATAKQHDGDATLYFPLEVAKIINEPFPGEKPIHGKAVPPPRAPAPASTTDQ